MRLSLALLCALAAPALSAPDPTGIEQHVFDSLLGQFPDLTYAKMVEKLPAPAYRSSLGFDPTKLEHYKAIAERLGIDAKAAAKFRRTGVLSVNTGRRYSMGSAYQDIYMKDLPLLVTTDSVLHAIHRSFDSGLADLESEIFLPEMRDIFMDAREVLKKADADAAPEVAQALRDADLYFTVALNLFRGAGGPAGDRWSGGWDGKIQVVSAFEQDAAVLDVLGKVRSLTMETRPATTVYGMQRQVDWSQFKPRGHYTKSASLQAYFRGMMWLGRADTGLNLTPNPAMNLPDPIRERRAAVAVALALKLSRKDKALSELDRLIGALVGTSDNLGVDALNALLPKVGIKKLSHLASAKKDKALLDELVASGIAAQRIRSQAVVSYPWKPGEVPPPMLFQAFGQRFLIDSFVLSKVVYDSIVFEGEKKRRLMPTGLDAMAALGNDEAVRLLKPELETWKYGANLQAARELVASYPDSAWKASIYQRWLNALRTLDDRPKGKLPRAMQTQAWARKMLRTQLGSWAELRHDTILYGKQSYTAVVGCEYPDAFVEPYPMFYATMGDMARETGAQLRKFAKVVPEGRRARVVMQADFWGKAAKHLGRLRRLAQKELAGRPFAKDDVAWLRKTIDKRGGGSGPPRYDGWYTELFFIAKPDKWAPTVADVHTDMNTREVLEVAVGDAELMVVAVDNEGDKALYVGPAYSYYEWAEPDAKRLTDQEWEQRLRESKQPPAPVWTAPFRP